MPQRTHRARNCDVTVRVSRQLTVLVPVRQQAKCEAKHWFSHWLHSKWKVLKKHIKREIALLKHFFSSYNIEISNLYSYHIFKYWNFDMLCFSLFLCPNGKLGCCWNVRQVAVFTYTGIQSRVPPLGVCSVPSPLGLFDMPNLVTRPWWWNLMYLLTYPYIILAETNRLWQV